jgi:four helix bundle protein
MAGVTKVEDLVVYRRLCELHIEVCALTRAWPREERFELASQVRRASNSGPANLAEKHSDRHVRNRIEGVNRARGEVLETIHHLYIATLKGHLARSDFDRLRGSYEECLRMLNGLERALERQLPVDARQWPERGGAAAGPDDEPRSRSSATTAGGQRPGSSKLKTEN